ncbi:hypothetical protein MBLNU13_g09056t1 [Cladosporium sp. NU13]
MASPTSQQTTKPQFWRIRNIGATERDAAEEWLQEQINESDVSEGTGFSLAADSEWTLCATVTSRGRPVPPKHTWLVDDNFIGFTPLCDPENAEVDIVAVTGLGGHALGSFRSTSGATVWLRDFAPRDVPQARFITYGYDTGVFASNSNQGVRDLAGTLLDSLVIFRQSTQTQKRPLLFVCHSLGGVVLKEALVMSSKAVDAKHKKLLEVTTVTYGLVFLGVPNLGLKHNQLETVVRGRPNEGFVRDLLVRSDGEASQFLSYLTSEFSDLDKRRRLPFEIISYYETVSSPTVADLGGGRFATDGPRELMVTKMSAERIGHFVRNIDHLSSETDHRGLVRFEHSYDRRYDSLRQKLKEMAAKAPQALHSRARSGYFGGEVKASHSFETLKYLPFSQNKDFIGRQDEMNELERKLFIEQDCQKAAIVGLGGVGKTQVALQFAHSVLERHPDISVFWMHAMSAETFEHSCRELANVLGILDAANDKEDVRELVRRHLSKKVAGKWVLIVDNADDTSVLDGHDGNKGILGYLPESEAGLAIFTTRDKKMAHRLAGNNIVDLEKLELVTATKLFKKMLPRKGLSDDEAVIVELLGELDCLPLAITQAAAYLNCNPISIGKYLSYLRGTESNMVYVMSQEMGDPTRDKHGANAVAKTWLVSFDQILLRDPDAAEILQYMSCIEWKAIPRSILPALEPEARMATAIGRLWSYAFIGTRNDNKTYDMHRLVHVAVRVWVGQKGMTREVQSRAIGHLSDIFPSDDYDNREVWREYVPHAARIRDVTENDLTEHKGSLCLKVGRCLMVDGRIADAVSWLEESRDLREKLPDENSDKTSTEHCLAISYQANGQVKEAVRLLEHVVAIRERVLAEDHPHRLTSQGVLAVVYQANGQVKEAVKEAVRLLEHVVAIKERVLAEDHPSRLASQHNLASAYQANGQVKEAVRLLEHVVAIRERVLAEDHSCQRVPQHEVVRALNKDHELRQATDQLLAKRKVVEMKDTGLPRLRSRSQRAKSNLDQSHTLAAGNASWRAKDDEENPSSSSNIQWRKRRKRN